MLKNKKKGKKMNVTLIIMFLLAGALTLLAYLSPMVPLFLRLIITIKKIWLFFIFALNFNGGGS